MPLPLTVSRFSKMQIGFTFLVLAHAGSPGQMAIKLECVRVCVCACGSVLFYWCLIAACIAAMPNKLAHLI